MSALLRGFNPKDLTYHGKSEIGRVVVNVGKALPASTTGNLFVVTGGVVVTGLVGVVSTATAASNVSPTLGVTNLPTALAAAPAAPLNTVPVGSVLYLPPTMGGALPAPVSASGAVNAASMFVVTNTAITMTTAASVTGNITWYLSYLPLYQKVPGSVAAV
jgi:hypothetical protein